ncbi:hypothetical protein ACHAPE_007182 [Trichoderma viride]
MQSITHKVDPNGDTLLILRNPNAPFGGDAAVWANALCKHRPEKLRRNERELKLLAQAKQETPDGPQEVQFQLSSEHLRRTSGYFQALMANNWKEASSSPDFVYSVTAEDWDEAALLMVMKIIHCQTSEIPQVIDSEMVAKIAVIVDYYQCRKVVDTYAKTWVQNLDAKELTFCGYGRKLLLRLFVSHYFSNDVDFNRCTHIIIRESRGPIHSLGLPFPQNIIDALEDQRKLRVSDIITGLHKTIERFRKPHSPNYSSTSVSALVNTMKAMKLFEPEPAPPFAGYSVAAIERGLLRTWSDYKIHVKQAKRSKRGHSYLRHGIAIDPAEQVRTIFVSQSDRIPELRLGDLVDVRKKS